MRLTKNLRNLSIAIILAFGFALGIAYAHDHMDHMNMDHKDHDMKNSQAVTLTGQIIDPVCFTQHNSKGADHKKCAETCAKAGINMAFLDEKANQIYLLIAPNSHESINKTLLEKGLLEEKVNVTGVIYEKSGIKTIALQNIEKAK